ncbi:MAG: transcriptional regulator [Thermofilum sp. ex4484_15]|nr:MAG: transcriptional regulator [Thermofilum sp. ex4484_15]
MAEEIPLKPVSKSEVHKLETALMIATLLRPDVIEKVKSAEERLTWIDSLAVAAGALARERAGYPISRIADELGRTEATIRNHLSARTEAGKLIRETYERFVREGVRIELPSDIASSDISKRLEEAERRVKELEGKITEIKGKLKELLESI